MAVESPRFAQLAGLPPRPGCYLFRDETDTVLYVGKSASLRSRVRSYFNRPPDGRTGEMVARVVRIETIVTDTETAARVLEAELIRRHAPPYNIRREHVPYVCITIAEPFPRVRTAARRHADGNRYFGPYASPESVGAVLRVLQVVFDLRIEDPAAAAQPSPRLPEDHSSLSRLEYRAAVNGAIRFLEGDTGEVARVLQERMEEAAADHAFEEAARIRDLWRTVSGPG
jgi:excinuclease ABC subunit C